MCCGNVSRHTLLNETELWSWLSLFIVHRLETYRIVEHQHNNNLKILKKTLRGWEAVLCWGPAINDIRVSHIPTLALQKAKSVCLNWVWKYHHYEYISEIEDVVLCWRPLIISGYRIFPLQKAKIYFKIYFRECKCGSLLRAINNIRVSHIPTLVADHPPQWTNLLCAHHRWRRANGKLMAFGAPSALIALREDIPKKAAVLLDLSK